MFHICCFKKKKNTNYCSYCYLKIFSKYLNNILYIFYRFVHFIKTNNKLFSFLGFFFFTFIYFCQPNVNVEILYFDRKIFDAFQLNLLYRSFVLLRMYLCFQTNALIHICTSIYKKIVFVLII